ncbi:MAG: relaxase domain-containing protein [Rhodospirillales bacterium]|nr:relaxase domain-containing protein [Rhodospirillales bacterium]
MLYEYLVRNDKAHRTANRWHGRGAEALGLPERVSRRRFVAILEGHVPGTDIRLGRVVDGEHQHRPGWDGTFSAPKSVSLEALLHDNRAVIRAHDASVRAALDWMEAEFLQTRGYEPETGRRPRVKANGLVAATFRHVASRNNDPQLHTHAVIANMTRNAAGEWRSVEPTQLQRNRRLIGAWYRNDLARRLGELGYVLVPTQVGGLPSFELAGYSPAMLEAFSTRRRDILDYMADKGWKYDAKAAQAATLHTRKRKDEPERDELSAMWKARAEALGLARDADAVRLGRTERGLARPPARFTPLEAVWQAVDHLEERHAVFGESDLLAAALGREPGRHTHVDLRAGIERLREDGHLVAAGEGALTTRRTLRAEKEVVRRMREGNGTARPLAAEEAVAGRLAATELTKGQKEAVHLILRSPDPVVGVQGFAGTGKTRMLNEVAALAGDRRVFGLAPSAAAARVLGVEGGIGTTTLQWLLTRYGSIAEGTASEEEIARARETFDDAVVVVDEASMVGTVQMRDLQRILAPLGVARLVLVGDSLQLRSVAAGQPFRLLQRAGMATARMDDVIRQRSVDLKAAVEHMVAGDPALAVESIAADVRELPADALAETAARLWLSLPPDARKGTVILAPTHEIREGINAFVRRGLADEGVLGRRSVEIGRLVDRKLTRVHAADPQTWRPGDVVVANRDVYGLREGEAWTVAGTGQDGVQLERRGETRTFAPSGNAARNLSLCESRPLPLRAGDEIVWTRNIRRRGLINGERATVERIAGDRIHVRTHSGRGFRFGVDDDDLRHIDHAWSSTVYRAQGLTRDNVIAVLDSASMMSDRAMLYVEMSRARDGFVLLTDDTEQLVSRLEREGESVSSALEAAGLAPWLEPDRAVTEKPALWPVLEEWHAHVQRAEKAGVPPFHLDGCDALIARMGALAKKDLLPGAVAGVLEEHRPFAEDRAFVSDWTSSVLDMAGQRERMLAEAAAAGTAVTTVPGHAAWSRRAEGALEDGIELEDEERYGVHLDRIAGARAQLGEPLDKLGRALAFDGNAASLMSEWRAWERCKGDGSLEELAARIAALAREAAPKEMPPDLIRAADEIVERQREEERRREHEERRRKEEERQREYEQRRREEKRRWTEEFRRRKEEILQRVEEERRREEEERELAEGKVRDMQSALEALAHERTQLLHAAAAVEPVAERPDWQDWRDRAEAAMAEAAAMAEDAVLGEGTREALAASAEELAGRLALDREAAELYRDWYEHVRPLWGGPIYSFHAPGTEALADRIAALEERVAHPLEMPGLLRMGLDDHRERAEEWSRIRECREDLARLAGRPEPGSEEWLPDARATARKAAAILNDGTMCRLHGLTGTPMGEEMEGNAAALARELVTHDASERLLRDWEAHAGAAAEEGLHPYHAPGYDALLDRIQDHEKKAGKRMPAPLARALEEHEPLVRSAPEARKLAGRLDACLEKRDALLERAERKLSSLQPVAELGWRHARWHRAAGRAREAGRELLGNDRYAAHLSALGGRAKIERAVERIERAAVLDHLPASVVAACETLDDRVRETGRHRFFLPEHERACKLMSPVRDRIRDDAARAFVKDELAMRKTMSEQARRLDRTKTQLAECQRSREIYAEDDRPFVQRWNYGDWRSKAERAIDSANSILDDENKLAPFFEKDPGLRRALAAPSASLGRTMRDEDEEWERIRRERAEQQRLERSRSRSRGPSM